MGTNTRNQQPGSYGAFNPQGAGMNALVSQATTPYQGNAPGGGSAQGAAQIAAALMAAQRLKQWKNKFGVPTYNNPAAMPGAVTPGGGTQATMPAQSAVMQSDPMAGMGAYA
jgi:hypothetical protein